MDNEQEQSKEVPPAKQTINRIQTLPLETHKRKQESEIRDQRTQFSPYDPTKPMKHFPVLERGGEAREIINPGYGAEYLSPHAGDRIAEEKDKPHGSFPEAARIGQVIEPGQLSRNARNPPLPVHAPEEDIEEIPRSIDDSSKSENGYWGYNPFSSITGNKNVQKVVTNPLVRKGALAAANYISPIPLSAITNLPQARSPREVALALTGAPLDASNQELVLRAALRAAKLPPDHAAAVNNLLNHAFSYMTPNGAPKQEEAVNGKSPPERPEAQSYFERMGETSANYIPFGLRP